MYNMTAAYIQTIDWEASAEEARDHYVCHAKTETELRELWFEHYMEHQLDCPADLWPYIDRALIDRERQHQCHAPATYAGKLWLFRTTR